MVDVIKSKILFKGNNTQWSKCLKLLLNSKNLNSIVCNARIHFNLKRNLQDIRNLCKFLSGNSYGHRNLIIVKTKL